MRESKLKILNEEEKKQFINKLKEQFGIKALDGLLVQRNEGKIYLFTGNLNKEELLKLLDFLDIDRIGVYFGKIQNDKIRLSIEGSQLLKDQISKNIYELSENEVFEWMKGQELLISTGKRDFLIMKSGDDFLGTGKASENKITNFIPKARRLKK